MEQLKEKSALEKNRYVSASRPCFSHTTHLFMRVYFMDRSENVQKGTLCSNKAKAGLRQVRVILHFRRTTR